MLNPDLVCVFLNISTQLTCFLFMSVNCGRLRMMANWESARCSRIRKEEEMKQIETEVKLYVCC